MGIPPVIETEFRVYGRKCTLCGQPFKAGWSWWQHLLRKHPYDRRTLELQELIEQHKREGQGS